MSLQAILTAQENKFGSILRAVIFFALAIGIATPVSGLVSFMGLKFGIGGTLSSFFLGGASLCIVALCAGWICARFIERLPFSSLGFTPTGSWLRDLLLGLIIGGATFCFACLIGVVSGSLSFTFNSEATLHSLLASMGTSLIVLGAAAAFEEAFFRGYPFQTLTRANLSWLAIAITSFFFGAAHILNPGASRIALINTILAGVWFGIAYLKFRNLWFPFGLHLAWNWVQGNIFGIEISGLSSLLSVPLMYKSESGPSWLSGGSYGIEGGIVCTVALGVAIVVIYVVPFKQRVTGDR